MKSKARIYILLAIILSFCVSSCKDSNNNDTEDPTNSKEISKTNKWIYEQMKAYYLWNTDMNHSPNFKETDARKFLNSLRYRINETEGDRFSYMEEYNENSSKAGSSSNDLGFEYVPVYIDNTKTKVGFIVIYVKDNTNAQKEGVKRGDIIIKVNDKDIVDNENSSNHYQTILKDKTSFTFSVYRENTIKELEISTTPNYKDNPVFISKVIPLDGGHKIGYLMYNAFEQGDNYEFDIELANALTELKTLGITDLVVDLRYNLGGYVKSAVNLASALVPSGNKGKIFCKSKYNDVYQAKLIKDHGEDAALNERFVETVYKTRTNIPQMNLSRVYFLTGQYTASASELVINGLTPYMTVIRIGTTTTGKDKSSIEILPTDKEIHWKLQPLVGRLRNAKDEGNYITGLKPTKGFEIDEFDEGFFDLGDSSEPLLARAIEDITGKQVRSKLRSGTSDLFFAPIKDATISLKPERSGLIINSDQSQD